MENRKLSIPIYLNQKIVFDLLTIIEQGFSKIQKVNINTTEPNESKSNENISFLSVALNEKVSDSKIFTPSSLFSKLRDELINRQFLKIINESYNINKLETGDFVEFTALLRKNPLLETLEGFVELMEVSSLFDKTENLANSKGKKKEPDQLVEIKKFISKINQTNTLDLLGKINHDIKDIQAVVPVEIECFTNKTPADLIDGHFTVLGKIIKSIDISSDESINLLRGTSLGLIPKNHKEELVKQFSQVKTMGFQLPEMVTEVKGPALQIIPIAIYI